MNRDNAEDFPDHISTGANLTDLVEHFSFLPDTLGCSAVFQMLRILCCQRSGDPIYER